MKRQPLSRLVSVAVFVALALLLSSSLQRAQTQGERARELKFKVGVAPDESDQSGNINLWGVIIGVSRYKNGDQSMKEGQIPNLKNAGDDAQAVYDFLRSPNGGNFRDVSEGGHLTLLKDETATKANIETALNRLRQSRPNDFFVIYIAAHGALVPQVNPQTRATEETPYFVLHDSELGNMPGTSIRMDSFRKL